jgi:hypothetical protein
MHTLLDRLPLAGDVLPALPPQLKARLFQAFVISVLWNKPGSQATVRAEITETTLQSVPGILNATCRPSRQVAFAGPRRSSRPW